MKFRSDAHPDYDSFGFSRAEIEAFLNQHGKSLTGKVVAASTGSEQRYPEWGRRMIGVEHFKSSQCAMLLCGFDPFSREWGWMSEDDLAEVTIAEEILSSAVKKGLLTPDIENGDALFDAESVREWCPSVGRTWPIPPLSTVNSIGRALTPGDVDDTTLFEHLQRAEARALDAETKLKQLVDVANEVDKLREQVLKLRAEAAKQLAKIDHDKLEIQNLNARIQSLQAELDGGKSRAEIVQAVVDKHKGNMSAAGRELNMTRQRVSQIIKPKKNQGKQKVILAANNPFNFRDKR